jgi:hypothetical protein
VIKNSEHILHIEDVSFSVGKELKEKYSRQSIGTIVRLAVLVQIIIFAASCLKKRNVMEYEFSVTEVDEHMMFVASPQLRAYKNINEAWVVDILFMENSAAFISRGIAKPGMGKIVLEYEVEYPDGAAAASIKLFKVQYVFPNTEGMPTEFEFKGGKTPRRRNMPSKMNSRAELNSEPRDSQGRDEIG